MLAPPICSGGVAGRPIRDRPPDGRGDVSPGRDGAAPRPHRARRRSCPAPPARRPGRARPPRRWPPPSAPPRSATSPRPTPTTPPGRRQAFADSYQRNRPGSPGAVRPGHRAEPRGDYEWAQWTVAQRPVRVGVVRGGAGRGAGPTATTAYAGQFRQVITPTVGRARSRHHGAVNLLVTRKGVAAGWCPSCWRTRDPPRPAAGAGRAGRSRCPDPGRRVHGHRDRRRGSVSSADVPANGVVGGTLKAASRCRRDPRPDRPVREGRRQPAPPLTETCWRPALPGVGLHPQVVSSAGAQASPSSCRHLGRARRDENGDGQGRPVRPGGRVPARPVRRRVAASVAEVPATGPR